MFAKILRYYFTLQHLKVKQIVWRFIYFLPRTIAYVDVCPSLALFESSNYSISKKITSDFEYFTFLNETHNLKKIGWDNKSVSKLWKYNLHYFEFLLQEDKIYNSSDLQLSLIENWIDLNPFGKGTGWEPYPTSLRIINWVKWHWSVAPLSDRAVVSLWNQVRWLASRPEYHLLGNHLFINAKALLFASSFFQLTDDSRIYGKAISILTKELDEQFLADGAHFELSPMYHSLAMEDLLDLLNISNKLPISFPKSEIESKCMIGLQWLKTMVFNNDELSHFNDCANGISPTLNQLKTYAGSLGLNWKNLDEKVFNNHKESGFIVFKDSLSHLIADIGKVGPDYLPGHAHADTLSFELAVKGHRVIVNSGTSVYGSSPERLRQRGTASHSTIQIDEHNSSDVWSGFRVARRAKPFNIQINSNLITRNNIYFKASHNGYEHLKNAPIHKREWTFNGKEWHIQDEITGNKNQVTSRYYLHPDIQLEKSSNGFIISKNTMNLAELEICNSDEIEIFHTTFHDQFGVSKPNKCIQVKGINPCKLGIKIKIL